MNMEYLKTLYRWADPVYRTDRVMLQHCEVVAQLKSENKDYTGNLVALMQYLKYCSQRKDDVSKKNKSAILSFLENTFGLEDLYKIL